MSQRVRFTPLGTILSLVLIGALIWFGYNLVTGKGAGPLGGLFGKKSEQAGTDGGAKRPADTAKAPSTDDRGTAARTEGGASSTASTTNTPTGVLAKVKSAGVVRFGMEDEAPPMNSVVGGRHVGFDVEIAQRIAQNLGGLRAEIVEAPYDELPDLLRTGRIDLMMGGYVPDPSLTKIDWSEGYLDFGLCLIIRQGSAVREPKHLEGKTVGIYTDPAAREWVEQNVPGVTIREFDGTGWFTHLDQGTVDAIVYDYPFAVEEIKQFPRLRIVKLNLNASSYSVGIPAGNLDLLDAVNAALTSITGGTGFDTIVKQFFKTEQLQVQALPAGTKTYEVKPGDSLSGIAARVLGSSSAWPQLWELNKDRIANPHLIEVGFQLRLP